MNKNNREIKFRVWDKDYKSFREDFYIKANGSFFIQDMYENEILSQRGSRYKIQQYTGLKDKNEKEIFEGDILSFFGYGHYNEEEKLVGTVVFSDELIMYVIEVKINNGSSQLYCLYKSDNKYYEIIGNIFENPKLLNNE